MADDRHNVAMPSRFGAQNTKAIFRIVVRDALDQAGQHFVGGWLRLLLHGGDAIVMLDCCFNAAMALGGWVIANVSRPIWPLVVRPIRPKTAASDAPTLSR